MKIAGGKAHLNGVVLREGRVGAQADVGQTAVQATDIGAPRQSAVGGSAKAGRGHDVREIRSDG